MKPTTAPPAWFHNAIVSGIQLLYSLSLPGCPAGEVLPLTTTGWVEVLWRGGRWTEALDERRVPLAFSSLARASERWPAPKQLLDHLPPPPEAPALVYDPPPISAERRAELATLRRRVTERLTSIPHVRAVSPDTSDPVDCSTDGAGKIGTGALQVGTDPTGRDPTS